MKRSDFMRLLIGIPVLGRVIVKDLEARELVPSDPLSELTDVTRGNTIQEGDILVWSGKDAQLLTWSGTQWIPHVEQTTI